MELIDIIEARFIEYRRMMKDHSYIEKGYDFSYLDGYTEALTWVGEEIRKMEDKV